MEINLTDPRFYGGDPYAAYAWLRENAPVYWDTASDAWVVSRHEDVISDWLALWVRLDLLARVL